MTRKKKKMRMRNGFETWVLAMVMKHGLETWVSTMAVGGFEIDGMDRR